MKDDFNLYRAYQLEAAEKILEPDESAYFRKICRWYSKNFHTPLFQVYKLPIDHVLTNYYESTMEDIPYNDLIDLTVQDFLPELAEQEEDGNDAYAKALEEEQQLTLDKKNPKIAKIANKQQSLDISHDKDQPSQPDDVVMVFPDEEP